MVDLANVHTEVGQKSDSHDDSHNRGGSWIWHFFEIHLPTVGWSGALVIVAAIIFYVFRRKLRRGHKKASHRLQRQKYLTWKGNDASAHVPHVIQYCDDICYLK